MIDLALGPGTFSFGILPSAYVHMAEQSKDANADVINKAISRYQAEMGEDPQFFAYPYGEYSVALKKQVGDYTFKAAFGEQSGVLHAKSDFMALPRFTMTDNYGDLERFQLTANALPLPVTDIVPEEMLVKQDSPAIGFTVTPELADLSKLSCFVSGSGKVDIARLGAGRVELRLKDKLEDRRTRINCTMPDATVTPGQAQSWRWFGLQLLSPGYSDDTATDAPAADGDNSPGDE